MYEIFEKLCDLKDITPYRFGKDMKVNSSTISTWKKKKSLAGPELAGKVCEYFGVSIDFLMGKTNEIECKECGYSYNPFDDFDEILHEVYHENIIEAKKKFPFLTPYRDIATIKARSLSNVLNNKDNRLESMQDYLKAEFSKYIYENYEPDVLYDYDNFCKTEVKKLIETEKLPIDYVDEAITTFGLDKRFVDTTGALLDRVSNNKQLISLLLYAEKLNAEQLDYLIIQVKALAEQNKNV